MNITTGIVLILMISLGMNGYLYKRVSNYETELDVAHAEKLTTEHEILQKYYDFSNAQLDAKFDSVFNTSSDKSTSQARNTRVVCEDTNPLEFLP